MDPERSLLDIGLLSKRTSQDLEFHKGNIPQVESQHDVEDWLPKVTYQTQSRNTDCGQRDVFQFHRVKDFNNVSSHVSTVDSSQVSTVDSSSQRLTIQAHYQVHLSAEISADNHSADRWEGHGAVTQSATMCTSDFVVGDSSQRFSECGCLYDSQTVASVARSETTQTTRCSGNVKSDISITDVPGGTFMWIDSVSEAQDMTSVLNTTCPHEAQDMKSVPNTCPYEAQDMKYVPNTCPYEAQDMKYVPNTCPYEAQDMKSVPNTTCPREAQDMKSVPNTTRPHEAQDMKSVPNTTCPCEAQDMKSVPNTTRPREDPDIGTACSTGCPCEDLGSLVHLSKAAALDDAPMAGDQVVLEDSQMDLFESQALSEGGEDRQKDLFESQALSEGGEDRQKDLFESQALSEGGEHTQMPLAAHLLGGEDRQRDLFETKALSEGGEHTQMPLTAHLLGGEDRQRDLFETKALSEGGEHTQMPLAAHLLGGEDRQRDLFETQALSEGGEHTQMPLAAHLLGGEDRQRDLFETQALSEGGEHTQMPLTAHLLGGEDRQRDLFETKALSEGGEHTQMPLTAHLLGGEDRQRDLFETQALSEGVEHTQMPLAAHLLGGEDRQRDLFETQALSEGGEHTQMPLTAHLLGGEDRQKMCAWGVHSCCSDQLELNTSSMENSSSHLQMNYTSQPGISSSNLRVKVSDQGTSSSFLQSKIVSEQEVSSSHLHVRESGQRSSSFCLQIQEVSEQGTNASQLQIKDVSEQLETSSSYLQMKVSGQRSSSSCLQIQDVSEKGTNASQLQIKDVSEQLETSSSNLQMKVSGQRSSSSCLQIQEVSEQGTNASQLQIKDVSEQLETSSSNLQMKVPGQRSSSSCLQIKEVSEGGTSSSYLQFKGITEHHRTSSSHLQIKDVSKQQGTSSSGFQIKDISKQQGTSSSDLQVKDISRQLGTSHSLLQTKDTCHQEMNTAEMQKNCGPETFHLTCSSSVDRTAPKQARLVLSSVDRTAPEQARLVLSSVDRTAPEEARLVLSSVDTTVPEQVVLSSVDTTAPEQVVLSSVDTTAPEQVVLSSVDTTAPEQVVLSSVDTTAPEQVVLSSVDTTAPEQVVLSSVDTTAPEQVVLSSVDTTAPEQVVLSSVDTTAPEQVVLSSVDRTVPEQVVLPSVDRTVPEQTTLVLPSVDRTVPEQTTLVLPSVDRTVPEQTTLVLSSVDEAAASAVAAEGDNCSTASHNTLQPLGSPPHSFQGRASVYPLTSWVSERMDLNTTATGVAGVEAEGPETSSQESKASSLLLNCPNPGGSGKAAITVKARPCRRSPAATTSVTTPRHKKRVQPQQAPDQQHLAVSGLVKTATDGLGVDQQHLAVSGLVKAATDGLGTDAQAERDLPADRSRHGDTHSLPAADKNIPAADKNIPAADKNIPAADKNIPAADKNIPAADKNIPAADKNIPAADKNIPTAGTSPVCKNRVNLQSSGRRKVYSKELCRLVDLYDKMLDKLSAGRVVGGDGQLQKFEQIVHKLKATHESYQARLQSSADKHGAAWQRQWQTMLDNQTMLAVVWDKHELLRQRVRTVQADGQVHKPDGLGQRQGLHTSASAGHSCCSSSRLQAFSSSAKQCGSTEYRHGKDGSGAVSTQLAVRDYRTLTRCGQAGDDNSRDIGIQRTGDDGALVGGKSHVGIHRPPGDDGALVGGSSSRDAGLHRTGGGASGGLTMDRTTTHLTRASAAVVACSIQQTPACPAVTLELHAGTLQLGSQVPENVTLQAGSQVPENVILQAGSWVPENVILQTCSQVPENVILQAGSQVQKHLTLPDESGIEENVTVCNDYSRINEDVISLDDDSDIDDTFIKAADQTTQQGHSTVEEEIQNSHGECTLGAAKGTRESFPAVARGEKHVDVSGRKRLLTPDLGMESADGLVGKVQIRSEKSSLAIRSRMRSVPDQLLSSMLAAKGGEITSPALAPNHTAAFIMADRTCLQKCAQQPQTEPPSMCLAEAGFSETELPSMCLAEAGFSETKQPSMCLAEAGFSETGTVLPVHCVTSRDTQQTVPIGPSTTEFKHRGPIVPGTADSGHRFPKVLGTTEFKHRGPIVPGTADSGHRFPKVPGTTEFKHRGPIVPGTADSGHRFPKVPGTTEFKHRGPIVHGTTDSGHRFPKVPGTTDSGHRFPKVLGTTDSGHKVDYVVPGTADSGHRFPKVPGTTDTEPKVPPALGTARCRLAESSSRTAADTVTSEVAASCKPDVLDAGGSTPRPAPADTVAQHVAPHVPGAQLSHTGQPDVHNSGSSLPSNTTNGNIGAKPVLSPTSTVSSSLFVVSAKEMARRMDRKTSEKRYFTGQNQITQTDNIHLYRQVSAGAKPRTFSIFGVQSVDAKNPTTKITPVKTATVDSTSRPDQAIFVDKRLVSNLPASSCGRHAASYSRNPAASGRRDAVTSDGRKRGRPRKNSAGSQGKKPRHCHLTNTLHQWQMQHYFPLLTQLGTPEGGSATNSVTQHGSVNTCLSTSQSHISLNCNTGTGLDSRKEVSKLDTETNKTAQLSTYGECPRTSSDTVDVPALIRSLRTVLLIADEEVTGTREDFPPEFWEEDFTNIRMSESFWTSLDDW